ncbi:hypothetical protein ACFE04_011646 [Oxalis oulophora]
MAAKVHNIEDTDVVTAKCECCGLTEEYTAAYIARVRERHEGRWICGLCAEVIKDEFTKRDDIATTVEALQRHISFCEQFRLASSPPPCEDLISAVMQLLKRTLVDSTRKKKSKKKKSGLVL